MVDFQNDTTVSTPPGELLKILIIQRRNDVIDGIETYYKQQLRGADVPDSVIRARMISLYYELGHAIRSWVDNTDNWLNTIKYADLDIVLNVFDIINEQLDLKKITRVDTRTDFDRKDSERENELMLG